MSRPSQPRRGPGLPAPRWPLLAAGAAGVVVFSAGLLTALIAVTAGAGAGPAALGVGLVVGGGGVVLAVLGRTGRGR